MGFDRQGKLCLFLAGHYEEQRGDLFSFQDVSFIVRPVHCYNITKDNWYTTEEGIDRVLGELTRCGNQFVTDVKNYLK